MTIEDFFEAKEGEEFEFKEAKNSFEYDKLVKYACAISNRGGGYIVFGISHGKYILGRRYYQQAGHGGVYTRQKGLKVEAIKALILQHIQENNVNGSQYSDFAEVFPSMARSSLQKVLRDMRNEKKIMVLGVKRGARWYLYDEAKLFAYADAKEAKNDKQKDVINEVKSNEAENN